MDSSKLIVKKKIHKKMGYGKLLFTEECQLIHVSEKITITLQLDSTPSQIINQGRIHNKHVSKMLFMPVHPGFVSWSCQNKLPKTWWLKNDKNLLSHSSGGQTSEIKGSAGPRSLWRLSGSFVPSLFQLLMAVPSCHSSLCPTFTWSSSQFLCLPRFRLF